MMMHLLIQIGFGLVAIASAFCVFVFWRAFIDNEKRTDARYRVVAFALTLSSIGVGMWAFNPLLQSFGGPALPLLGLFVASVLLLVSASLLVSSTAMGGNKRTLRAFLACCGAWIVCCVVLALL
jgi:hypothetical protein